MHKTNDTPFMPELNPQTEDEERDICKVHLHRSENDSFQTSLPFSRVHFYVLIQLIRRNPTTVWFFSNFLFPAPSSPWKIVNFWANFRIRHSLPSRVSIVNRRPTGISLNLVLRSILERYRSVPYTYESRGALRGTLRNWLTNKVCALTISGSKLYFFFFFPPALPHTLPERISIRAQEFPVFPFSAGEKIGGKGARGGGIFHQVVFPIAFFWQWQLFGKANMPNVTEVFFFFL